MTKRCIRWPQLCLLLADSRPCSAGIFNVANPSCLCEKTLRYVVALLLYLTDVDAMFDSPVNFFPVDYHAFAHQTRTSSASSLKLVQRSVLSRGNLNGCVKKVQIIKELRSVKYFWTGNVFNALSP